MRDDRWLDRCDEHEAEILDYADTCIIVTRFQGKVTYDVVIVDPSHNRNVSGDANHIRHALSEASLAYRGMAWEIAKDRTDQEKPQP